jgi:hypothetical protein
MREFGELTDRMYAYHNRLALRIPPTANHQRARSGVVWYVSNRIDDHEDTGFVSILRHDVANSDLSEVRAAARHRFRRAHVFFDRFHPCRIRNA